MFLEPHQNAERIAPLRVPPRAVGSSSKYQGHWRRQHGGVEPACDGHRCRLVPTRRDGVEVGSLAVITFSPKPLSELSNIACRGGIVPQKFDAFPRQSGEWAGIGCGPPELSCGSGVVAERGEFGPVSVDQLVLEQKNVWSGTGCPLEPVECLGKSSLFGSSRCFCARQCC